MSSEEPQFPVGLPEQSKALDDEAVREVTNLIRTRIRRDLADQLGETRLELLEWIKKSCGKLSPLAQATVMDHLEAETQRWGAKLDT